MKNIFEHIAWKDQVFRANLFCYEPKTTFMSDFSVAEWIGGNTAIVDTYNRAFEEWKNNTEYITEFVMVLNHNIHIWWSLAQDAVDANEKARCDSLARCYDALWRKADEWCYNHLTGEDLSYYYRTLD